MNQNILIETDPENILFFKNRKIFQAFPFSHENYKEQLGKIGTAKIIILVDKIDHGLTKPDNKTLLSKMLKAIESLGVSTALIEIDCENPLFWNYIKHNITANKFILFGLKFGDIGIKSNDFINNIIPFDGAYFLLSQPLKDFHDNSDLKNKIWKKMRLLVEAKNI